MKDNIENIVGIEIGTGYIQCSVKWKNGEVQTYKIDGKERLSSQFIYKIKDKEFFVGDQMEYEDGDIVFQDWETLFSNNQESMVDSVPYLPEQLFCKMICHYLKLMQGENEVDGIVFITEKDFIKTNTFQRTLQEQFILLKCNGNLKVVEIIGYETAYTSFVLSQEDCHGARSVGFIHFEDDITYRYLGKSAKTNLLQIERIRYEKIPHFHRKEDKDEKIAQIIKKLLYEKKTAILYLTGKGFTGNWMKKTLQILCYNRRAFLGQSLYTKGGIQYLKYKMTGQLPPIIAEGLCQYDIGIVCSQNGEKRLIPIVRGGYEWYLQQGKIEVIIEKNEGIEIVFLHLKSQEMKREWIVLDGLPKRPDRTTRLKIEVYYTGEKTGYITIKDIGFGTLYPTSHKIWVHTFQLR